MNTTNQSVTLQKLTPLELSRYQDTIQTLTLLRRGMIYDNLWSVVEISRAYKSITMLLEALPVEKLQGDDWAHVRSIVTSYHYLYECNKNANCRDSFSNNTELMRKDRESLARFVASKFVERLQSY